MFNLFSKVRLSALLALVSLSAVNAPLTAWECCESSDCTRTYIGAFGGGIYSDNTNVYQEGTVFFAEADGGPLAVLAQGRTKSSSAGFGGVQLGFESALKPIACSDWSWTSGGEFEAFFFRHKKSGNLLNSNTRLPEHEFADSFNLRSTVLMVNAVFSFNNCCLWGLTPYVAGGLGATRISLRNGTSTQVSPAEPGINHFNSRRSDSSWAFAAQVKTGLRYAICESFHLFGEYRYLYVDSSDYRFGSTSYPAHVPTSPWNVRVSNTHYNAFAFGVQYDL